MLLNKIYLENFRQYKDKQKIEFSSDFERNVTVVIGKNTGGKTTLVQAFIWCLYDKITFTDKNLLNTEKLYEFETRAIGAQTNVSVMLILTHKDIKYKIERTHVYEKTSRGLTVSRKIFNIKYSENNGDSWHIHSGNSDELIRSILPEDLSNYFFFWGEKIENIDSKKNISTAVKDFLGLSAINKSRDHLTLIITDYAKSMATLDKTNTQVKKLYDKLTQIEIEMPKKEAELKTIKDSIVYYEEKYKYYENELLKNQKSAAAAENVKRLENVRDREEKNIDDSFNAIIKNFNNSPYKYFSARLKSVALDVLNHLPEDQQGLAHQNEKSINELLQRGICVCGRPLKKHTEAYEHILKQLEKIPPKSIFALVEEYKKDIRNNTRALDNYKFNIINNYEKMGDSQRAYENAIDDIRKENLKINKDVNTADLKKSKDFNHRKYVSAIKEKQELEDEIKRLSNLKNQIIAQIEQRSKISEKFLKLATYKKYAEAVIKSIDEDYVDKETGFKKRLNELVNKYFKEIYHGNREITIDDNFKMKLVASIGNKKISTEESPGLQTVKNFAFIASLVEIAKEKRNSNNDDFELEPYPLVLDAPFSSADEIHVPNICKLISNVAEQTIIVVMEKDWNYAKKVMEKKVRKSYFLDKKSETYTIVKSIDVEV